MDVQKLLKKYFGHGDFRPLQENVVNHVLANKDALVVMPTGGGKSLCFQLPALMRDGLTIVISPLISLMKDQVDGLVANGIPATMINSSLERDEVKKREDDALRGKYKLIYLAPERLSNSHVHQWVSKLKITALAVDEAHCISQWGHDFRPDYRNLRLFRERFPQVPIVALTGSATASVQRDIVKQLGLVNHEKFISGFYRENLQISVTSKRGADAKIKELIVSSKGESTIVYCFSRKETQELSEYLSAHGLHAKAYHAGLSAQERELVQDDFIKDKVNIVVATVAFGMGIDKPDVRLVIHKTFPKTIEGYYQEIGRAGRDGLPSKCVMLYSAGDKVKLDFFLQKMEDENRRMAEEQKIEEVMDYASARICRWQWLTTYFGQTDIAQCGHCDICVSAQELEDATEIVQKILSAVVKTGNTFGKGHVVKVLRGSREKAVLEREHQNISVWGIAKEFTTQQLMEYFAHIIARGFVKRGISEFETYKITQRGVDFLKNKDTIMLPKIERSEAILGNVGDEEPDYNNDIFQALRALRKEIADDEGVPAFIIFGDVSLKAMAQSLPKTREEFLLIPGVGQRKLQNYGEQFISKIKEVSSG